jgi:hypothetical protein
MMPRLGTPALYWSVLLVAFALPAAPARAKEGLDFSFEGYPRLAAAVSTRDGHEPMVATEDRSPVYVLTRIVVEGKSADDWVEAFEIMNTNRSDSPRNVQAWYEHFHAQGEAHCASEWTVLAKSDDTLTFERKSGECPPHAAQQALYRVLYGKQNVFLLIGTRKGAMDEATRSAWLAVLGTASVSKGSR